jgi:hypothetical protein
MGGYQGVWLDGWMDGWMDGRMDGRMEICLSLASIIYPFTSKEYITLNYYFPCQKCFFGTILFIYLLLFFLMTTKSWEIFGIKK